MMWLSLLLLPLVICLEEVPRASGIKPVKPSNAASAKHNIRRAPIAPAEGLSLVPHAHRMSTGVRRAPNGPAVPLKPRPAIKLVRPGPLQPAVIPMIPLLNFPMLNLATVRPGAVPTLSPLALPTFPPLTLPSPAPMNLPPAPNGPITLAPMPTMPGFTMPPSFQRLLGMTTTAAPQREERQEYQERNEYQEKQYTDERTIKTKKRGLSSISSRLPKYIDNEDNVVSPEKNAEWIVPF